MLSLTNLIGLLAKAVSTVAEAFGIWQIREGAKAEVERDALASALDAERKRNDVEENVRQLGDGTALDELRRDWSRSDR